jgi:ATP sulfurylase
VDRLDSYSSHEVLDTSLESFDHLVVDHPLVESLADDDPVRLAIIEASEALARAYQAAGAAFL